MEEEFYKTSKKSAMIQNISKNDPPRTKKFKIPLDISDKYAIIQKLSDSEENTGV